MEGDERRSEEGERGESRDYVRYLCETRFKGKVIEWNRMKENKKWLMTEAFQPVIFFRTLCACDRCIVCVYNNNYLFRVSLATVLFTKVCSYSIYSYSSSGCFPSSVDCSRDKADVMREEEEISDRRFRKIPRHGSPLIEGVRLCF